jgi:hypothetical protein
MLPNICDASNILELIHRQNNEINTRRCGSNTELNGETVCDFEAGSPDYWQINNEQVWFR